MKSKLIKYKTKNKFLALVLCVGAMLIPKEVLAVDFDILMLSDLTFYPSGCLKSFDVRIKATNGSYRRAWGKIAVHNGTPVHNWDWPIREGEVSIWGSSWPEKFSKDNMVTISSGEFEWTDYERHYLNVSIADGVIPATIDKEYSVYLWSRCQEWGVYADTCFRQKLIVKDGAIKLSFDPTLFRYEYDNDKRTAEVINLYRNDWFEKIVIPETVTKNNTVYRVTSIGSYAFTKCSLPPVIIGNNVTDIEEGAFENASLPSITIGKNVKNIGNYAFSGCSSLTSVIIPNSVTNIGRCAFNGCSGLTSVTIGNSVKSIGRESFSECPKLISITCHATTPPTCGDRSFGREPIYKATLCVPHQSITEYQKADIWKDFKHWETYYSEDFGTPTTPMRKLGDISCNGIIDQDDVNLSAQYVVGKSEFPEKLLSNMDINHDGVIDVRDVVGIERIVNGYEVPADK